MKSAKYGWHGPGRLNGRLAAGAWLGASMLVLLPAHARAGGPAVVAGTATISTPTPGTTIVNQSTEKAILNWQSLSVPTGGLLRFQQPDSAAIALNRVLGGGPSTIDGSLLANGRVWIINPNGVMFGANATVNVGGLLATTADIRNSDFMGGNYAFGTPSANPNAAVTNAGRITAADGGSVILSAPLVANTGVIEATLGNVVLGGASAFTVAFQGDKLLSFEVTTPVATTPLDAAGKPAAALVANSGKISADGGTVLLTARAARNVLDNVINTTGMISATTAHVENGEIVLDAGPNGTASIGGQIDASGKSPGATGGTVKALGGTVAIMPDAVIDASGDAGGGTVLIGGSLHGAGPEPNAQMTAIAPGATIHADAITNGNGGTVVVWAGQDTRFDGAITVRGGAESGNGGMVETSGQSGLAIATGTVDALAPQGQTGTWLLDPTSIFIENGGTASLPDVGPGLWLFVNVVYDIDPSTIANAAANVTLRASGDITFVNALSMVHDGVGITALAGDSITVDTGASITTRGGAISFTANTGPFASGSGGIVVNAPLSTTGGGQSGGGVTLLVDNGGGSGITLGQNITAAAGAINLTGPIKLTASVTLDATNGGQSDNGTTVNLAGSVDGAHSLVIADAGGAVSFTGAVGGAAPLASLDATAGTVSFARGVKVAGALDTTGAGLTTFEASVTAGSVRTGAASLDGGSVTTGAGQSYGAASLGAATTLADTGAGAIAFDATLDGAQALIVSDAGGAVSFTGAVGGTAPLASLDATAGTVSFARGVKVAGALDTTGAGLTTFDGIVTAGSVRTGAVAFDGGGITTGAGQSYGAASLGAATTLADTGGSAIAFDATLDGAQALIVSDAGGAVSFTGAVGGTAPLASLDATAETVGFDGPLAVAGAVNTASIGTTTFGGSVTVGSLVTGATVLNGGGVATTGNQVYGGGLGLGADTTLAASGGAIDFAGNSAYQSNFALNVLAGGNIEIAGAVQNAGAGAITLIAGWDGTTPASQAVTTPSAYGRNGGSVNIGEDANGTAAVGSASVGSKAGPTTVGAANLTIAGINGYAQLGYRGGGATGTIDVAIPGTLALGAASDAGYAQIGHGGASTSGSESGTITVAAGGGVTLAAGSGSYAYAQIGHGGALTNQSATSLFSDTGNIAVTGAVVTLAGGSGDGAYAQIGHGGIGAAQYVSTTEAGSITYSGTITVTALTKVALSGIGASAYAQIGNGGYQNNAHVNLANASVTEQGDIAVTVGTDSSSGALTIVGDAYSQIGNGGNAANLGASVSGGVMESGNISINVNGAAGTASLVGDGAIPAGYAQIGNGDAAETDVNVPVNVGGDITINVASYTLSPGPPSASIWNATASGTNFGSTTVNGVTIPAPDFQVTQIVAPPPPQLPSSVSLASLLFSSMPSFGGSSLSAMGGPSGQGGGGSLGSSLNAVQPSSGESQPSKGPIESMTDSSGGKGQGGTTGSNGPSALPGGNADTGTSGTSGGSGAAPNTSQEADSLSSGIARSLSATPGVTSSGVRVLPQNVLIGGLLTQSLAPLNARDTPQSVTPADQNYSSWGNEALWDWQ